MITLWIALGIAAVAAAYFLGMRRGSRKMAFWLHSGNFASAAIVADSIREIRNGEADPGYGALDMLVKSWIDVWREYEPTAPKQMLRRWDPRLIRESLARSGYAGTQ